MRAQIQTMMVKAVVEIMSQQQRVEGGVIMITNHPQVSPLMTSSITRSVLLNPWATASTLVNHLDNTQ